MSKGPIFVLGANRSGTTLVRLILNAHSQIGIPDELIYINSVIAGVPIEQWRDPGLSAAQYDKFVNRFINTDCISLLDLDPVDLRTTILEGPFDFRRPYEVALTKWAHRNGKVRWGEKTPGNLFYADILLDMFPDSVFIYVVRDPRAGVSSMQKFRYAVDDVVFNALARHKHYLASRNILEKHVPPEKRLIVRYEDVVSCPEKTVEGICQFLGERFEPEMLAFHESASSYMCNEAADSYNLKATKPISTSMLDKWRYELKPYEVAMVEALCEKEMLLHGYTQSQNYLPLWHRCKMYLKVAYWHLQCTRRRSIRHYTVQHEPFARSKRRFRDLQHKLCQL